jgi:hypothetical protein
MKPPKCKWCGKRLDDRHSQAHCFALNEKKIRSSRRPRIASVSEAYHNGKLRPEFNVTDMEDILLKRQEKLATDAVLGLGDNGYKVPRNVSYMLAHGFVWNQIATQKPWAVYLMIPQPTGPHKRKRKRFNSLWAAVEFHKKAFRMGLKGGIVSTARGYDKPARLRFREVPRRFKWCPYCADYRVFHRAYPEERFFAPIKRWNETRSRYEWIDRHIWLTQCQLCGNTNRGDIFRRNNQPWELRRIKQGVRRVRPRKGAPSRRRGGKKLG